MPGVAGLTHTSFNTAPTFSAQMKRLAAMPGATPACPRHTCQIPCVLLPRAIHLALVAGQDLLDQIQHPKVLDYVVE